MPQPDFSRSLSEDRTKIISVCDICGHTITASVTEGLQNLEREHVKQCLRSSVRAS
jgi:hypothetical protein